MDEKGLEELRGLLWGCCGVVGLGFMASAGCRQPHTLLAMNASNPKAVMPQSRYDAAILRDFLFVFFRFFQIMSAQINQACINLDSNKGAAGRPQAHAVRGRGQAQNGEPRE